MDLHNGQVPSACVWAVVMDSPPGAKDVEWFITSEESSRDYREVAAHVKNKGGVAERWLVTLPAQRLEADVVTAWVEALLLQEDNPPTYARRLDVFKA